MTSQAPTQGPTDAGLTARVLSSEWQTMDTAPKGGGAEYTTDPNWVVPPKILLIFADDEMCVCYWEWHYAEGGWGYDGRPAWVEPCSGDLVVIHYGEPVGWQPLPTPPTNPKGAA